MVSSLTAELGRSLDTAMFPSKPFMKKSRRRRLAATILWRPFLPHMTGKQNKAAKVVVNLSGIRTNLTRIIPMRISL